MVGSAGRSGFRASVNEVPSLAALHLVYGEAGEGADTARGGDSVPLPEVFEEGEMEQP